MTPVYLYVWSYVYLCVFIEEVSDDNSSPGPLWVVRGRSATYWGSMLLLHTVPMRITMNVVISALYSPPREKKIAIRYMQISAWALFFKAWSHPRLDDVTVSWQDVFLCLWNLLNVVNNVKQCGLTISWHTRKLILQSAGLLSLPAKHGNKTSL